MRPLVTPDYAMLAMSYNEAVHVLPFNTGAVV